MTLNQFAAEKRLGIFEDLKKGLEPREGEFDPAILKEAQAKGSPQMGTTRYTPDSITFEFIYPAIQGVAAILAVKIVPPERIVFLPVPSWVVENIWQGEIAGTYDFESNALALLEDFGQELTPEGNRKWFEPQAAKRRE